MARESKRRVALREDRSSRLLDAAPDAIVIVNDKGVIDFVNLQTQRTFGYPRDELIGQPIEVLVPERYRATHLGHRMKFTAEPRTRPMGSGLELFGQKKDGSEFPIEISLSPVEIDGGLLISAAIRDITERKRLEAEARRVNAHLRSAVESIPGAFAIFDAEDVLVLCNSACRDFVGRGIQGPIIGRKYAELVDAAALLTDNFDLGDEPKATFRARRIAYHESPTDTLDVRSKEGRSYRISDRRTAEGGTVTTIWDLTEDVKRENELVDMRSLAEAASSAKSEFLSSMSHELRTPLNAILGFAQLLKRDKKTPLSLRQQERLDHILKGGEHLLRLIDDVLDLARIEAGRVAISTEPVSVQDVLQEVKSTLAPMATRMEIDLLIAPLPAALSKVLADRTRFAQILMNYGSNAIKYGRTGGLARFTVSTQPGRYVRVSVADDGMGIPADKQDKIFQPFQRAGQEAGPIEGTGIGLAITKRLAEMMHGNVGFHSKPGEGSEFWIDLPMQEEEVAPVAAILPQDARASTFAQGDGARHRVVYVEDNPSNIAFMKDLMSEFGTIELLTAPTAEIGVELVRAHKPHVVIMDINLPGMSGFDATRKLTEWPETRDIPVVALTAAAMIRDTERAVGAGFYRYLTKPVKVNELMDVLEELLAGNVAETSNS
jgi:PAS domain S-box-containing protein